MIEYLLECLKTVITNLINPLFALNCFAQASKSAEVTPNLKSSDSDEPKNTCPIPPPPSPRIALHQRYTRGLLTRSVLDLLDKNRKISSLQSGNRELHSTETPLCSTWTSSLRIWTKSVYHLLCCSTHLKLSTASSMTTYYQSCTHWVCRTLLQPGLRVTYHHACKLSGWQCPI